MKVTLPFNFTQIRKDSRMRVHFSLAKATQLLMMGFSWEMSFALDILRPNETCTGCRKAANSLPMGAEFKCCQFRGDGSFEDEVL